MWPDPTRALAVWLVMTMAVVLGGAQPPPWGSPSLDRGFQQLYNLDFIGAQQQFSLWQSRYPKDPMGPVAEAAGLLFSELNRLGVLEAQFFVKDSNFEKRPKLTPDAQVRQRFEAALARAEGLARSGLARDPVEQNALLALTLTEGLRADYQALIEKRNLASLDHTRQAKKLAEQLLARYPECYDAYLASGINDYIVGSLPAPVRWVLRLGGHSGDRQRGLEHLQLTADRGRYLAPFARMLLAIAYLRGHDKARARQILAELNRQFPDNSLFAREIARLDAGKD